MCPEALDLKEITREQELIESLLQASAYPHPVDNIRLIDTHISWVILTGSFAYKIKKPIKLEFLDFSSLEKRRHYCEEELRLNRRWLPELYLDVVPICGSFAAPAVGGSGAAIEYAVKMVQFPYEARLDQQLDAGLLDTGDMTRLAETVAERHGALPVCSGLGNADAIRLVRHPMLENLEHLKPYVSDHEMQPLATWTSTTLQALWGTVLQRQQDGYVRECHGDLHLANLVRLSSGLAAFDCVEFNADLRNIDVISDVSFLVMDLMSRGRQDLAFAFINRYLERTGDYDGMSVFGLYFVYHALIRAKILAIRSVERSTDSNRLNDLAAMTHFCDLARRWIEPRRPCLIVMHGYAGSGKTLLSGRLMLRLPAIRARSDIERKRRFDLGEAEASASDVGTGIYSPAARSDVYAALAATAATLLRAGQHVIVDASFLNYADRQDFRELAIQQDAHFVILDVCAKQDQLSRRVALRQRAATDASEADVKVLQYQYEHAQALGETELEHSITVSTDVEVDVEHVIGQIHAVLR